MKITTEFKDLTGKILIATPSINPQSYFSKTVIYVVKHTLEEGTIGLIVNHPIGKNDPNPSLERMAFTGFKIDNIELSDLETYVGGPVDSDKGFLLHTDQDSIDEANSIYLSSNIKLLKTIASGKGPKYSMFLLGYCGWGHGQLEDEIRNNEWLILEENKKIIFETSDKEKWLKALEQLKINPVQYINKPAYC